MMSTEFWYMFQTSDLCSRLARGTLKREGPAPKAAFAGEPKESGMFCHDCFGGTAPTGAAKPKAERASYGRRDDPEAVPARKRDRTEGRATIPDSEHKSGGTRHEVTRDGFEHRAGTSTTGSSQLACADTMTTQSTAACMKRSAQSHPKSSAGPSGATIRHSPIQHHEGKANSPRQKIQPICAATFHHPADESRFLPATAAASRGKGPNPWLISPHVQFSRISQRCIAFASSGLP